MREAERKLVRRKLDEEMEPLRRVGRQKDATNGLLRAIRQSLAIPVEEIARKMGVQQSAVWEREKNEEAGTITMRTLERQAEAMSCKVVYGIVPEGGKTLARLAEERYWRAVLRTGNRDQRSGTRESGEDGGHREAGREEEGSGTKGHGWENEREGARDPRKTGGERPSNEAAVRGDSSSGGEAETEMAWERRGAVEVGSGPGGGGKQRSSGGASAGGCVEGEDGQRAAAGDALGEEGTVAAEETARTVLG